MIKQIMLDSENKVVGVIVPASSIDTSVSATNMIVVDDDSLPESYINTYYSGGLFHTLPEKPSIYHKWDSTLETWGVTSEDIIVARNRKILDIGKVRKNLSLQTISYDDKSLDADTQAQANINGKIQEIFAREAANTPLTSGEMFWKDADNVIHSWTNQNDYKFWLQGLVIAISSRNTSLYATAWSKKAEVEALTNINDIINYDINTGW